MQKHHICEKHCIQNPAICTCKNGKYLANVIDNSVIMFDEVIDVEAKQNDKEKKTVPANFNEKDMTCKIQKFCIINFIKNTNKDSEKKHKKIIKIFLKKKKPKAKRCVRKISKSSRKTKAKTS